MPREDSFQNIFLKFNMCVHAMSVLIPQEESQSSPQKRQFISHLWFT